MLMLDGESCTDAAKKKKKKRQEKFVLVSMQSLLYRLAWYVFQKAEHAKSARQRLGKFCWLKCQVVYEGRAKKEIFCALAQRSAKIPHVHRLFFVHKSILYVITESVHHVFHVLGGLQVEGKKKIQLRSVAAQRETSRRY